MNTITLTKTNSDDPDFRKLIQELDADLRTRNGELMDIYDQLNVIEKIDTVVIAWLNGLAVGCGCFKPFDAESVEIKRMFVQSSGRGNGISALVLKTLEDWAHDLGFKYTVLETGSKQIEAQGLYQKAGYTSIDNYGPYVNLSDSFCFRKVL